MWGVQLRQIGKAVTGFHLFLWKLHISVGLTLSCSTWTPRQCLPAIGAHAVSSSHSHTPFPALFSNTSSQKQLTPLSLLHLSCAQQTILCSFRSLHSERDAFPAFTFPSLTYLSGHHVQEAIWLCISIQCFASSFVLKGPCAALHQQIRVTAW